MTVELLRSLESLLPGSQQLGQELLTRWSEPHRRYHGLQHLSWALQALAELGGTARTEQLAIWFHDAVHAGTPGSDEQASADLAVRSLGEAGLPVPDVAEVARLVLVTRDHAPNQGDAAGARVSDADLAILGAEPADYLASVASLRAESPGVSEDTWRNERLAGLAGLLGGAPLFHTAEGRGRWEARARANLAAEQLGLLG